MTASPKKRSPVVVIVVVIALCAACVPCTGVLAAIAIPSFVSYVRRAKTIEARTNVTSIAQGVAVAYEQEHIAPDGTVTTRALPPSLARTPATASAQRRPWPVTAEPGWGELGFAPPDPIYYSYEYARDPDARGFVVRAYGDLDGDGVESRFEQRGAVDASTGELRLDPIAIVDELE